MNEEDRMMNEVDWTTMLGKVELTLAWLELEQLVTTRLIVMRPAAGQRMWRALSEPAPRGISRPLVVRMSRSALRLAADRAPDATGEIAVGAKAVQAARAICVTALQEFGHQGFA
jgi:hypothetical protein